MRRKAPRKPGRPLNKPIKRAAGRPPADVLDPQIPFSYFVEHNYLSPGQALSLYLIEEVGLSFREAGIILQRTESTIRLGYWRAKEKQEEQKRKKKDTKDSLNEEM